MSWFNRNWTTATAAAGGVAVAIGLAMAWPPLAWCWFGGCLIATAAAAAYLRSRPTP